MVIKPEFCFGSVAYLYFVMIYYHIVSGVDFFKLFNTWTYTSFGVYQIYFTVFRPNPKRGPGACVINRRIPRSCL